VISNTSPLFYLHQLGCLDLLQKLYGQIVIPKAVFEELEEGRRQGECVPDVQGCDWIKIRSVRIPSLVRLVTDFGAGEAQVLALALEEPNCLVILDERLAREVAELQNLRITGTAGVLLKAKQQGYISAVRPLLDNLMQSNFRLSDQVRIMILKRAQE
jgi:predicted nucleic acid-binding protein